MLKIYENYKINFALATHPSKIKIEIYFSKNPILKCIKFDLSAYSCIWLMIEIVFKNFQKRKM